MLETCFPQDEQAWNFLPFNHSHPRALPSSTMLVWLDLVNLGWVGPDSPVRSRPRQEAVVHPG